MSLTRGTETLRTDGTRGRWRPGGGGGAPREGDGQESRPLVPGRVRPGGSTGSMGVAVNNHVPWRFARRVSLLCSHREKGGG